MEPISGDLVILKDVVTGKRMRDGILVDVRGDDLAPVYLVRWSDSGDLEMYLADETAYVHHFERGGVEEFSLVTGFPTRPE